MNSERLNYLLKDFGKIIKHNALSFRQELGNDTDCFRVYDCNLDDLRVVVEKYGKCVRIIDYLDLNYAELGYPDDFIEQVKSVCFRMLYVEKDHVFYVKRGKDLERKSEKNMESFRSVCCESGLKFEVEMLSYIDSGLFLENVYARRFIRDNSNSKDVLNLFSYTGSFSVYALSGGAKSVISADISENYTHWAERNVVSNNYSTDICKCVCADAREYVEHLVSEKSKFDIIIFDPPVFSNSRKMDYDFRAERDSVPWIKRISVLLRKGGFILFCNNTKLCIKQKMFSDLGLKVLNKTEKFKAPGFIKKNSKGKTEHFLVYKEF